jgi:UDP-glucose 4-epimerase
MDDLYYSVNRDLAIETALKAKQSGVKQFIFMSSIIIYGDNGSLTNKKSIDKNNFNPINAYGKSKLEADLSILNMNNHQFKCVVIRTPVIYGNKCKGNFPKLIKIAKYAVIFPNIKNKKSMIYIDFLSESVKYYIDNQLSGVFFPQNSEYVSTKDVIKVAREFYGKKYRETMIFNIFIFLLSMFSNRIRKIFGNKFYDHEVQYYTNKLSVSETILRAIESEER